MPIIDNRHTGGGGAVDSVNAKTGVVVLGKADIGLPLVDNTSDVNKPVSTAQQAAIDKAGWVHPNLGFRMIEPWQGATFVGVLNWSVATNGGSVAMNNSKFTTSAGVVAIQTGAVATGAPFISLNGTNATFMLGVYIPYSFEKKIKLDNLSTSTEEFIVRTGFVQSLTNSTAPLYGVWFEYNRAVNGDFWCLVTNDNGSITTVVTTTPVTLNFVRLKIWVNTAGTLAKFFVDDVKVGEITTNIPRNNTAKALNPGTIIAKTVGTTTRPLYLDWAMICGGTGAPDPEA